MFLNLSIIFLVNSFHVYILSIPNCLVLLLYVSEMQYRNFLHFLFKSGKILCFRCLLFLWLTNYLHILRKHERNLQKKYQSKEGCSIKDNSICNQQIIPYQKNDIYLVSTFFETSMYSLHFKENQQLSRKKLYIRMSEGKESS